MDSTYKFRFIDLFAGIGGIRLAFENHSGFEAECVFTSEIDKYAVKTYQANFPDEVHGDITQIHESDIPEHDVLLAGFPCQPFSLAGVSKYNALGWKHGFEHATKGTLFHDIARIIAYRKPKAFLLENVKNLKSHDKGRTWQVIHRTLTEELGYHVSDGVFDAANVVPQHRERVLIVGFREPVPFQFPTITDTHPQLGNILDPVVDPKYTLTDHLWSYLQEYAEKHRAKGNGFGFGLANLDGVSRTLSARYYKDGAEILIPQEGKNPRRLTPRECARLQGFADKFDIEQVSDTQAYKQFGNAVAVPLIRMVARELLHSLRDYELSRKVHSNGRHLGQEKTQRSHVQDQVQGHETGTNRPSLAAQERLPL